MKLLGYAVLNFCLVCAGAAGDSFSCHTDWSRSASNAHHLEQVECKSGSSGRREQTLRLDGNQVILATNSRIGFAFTPVEVPTGVLLYTLADDDRLTCPSRLLMVDTRRTPVKAFEFGISQRCAEPSQAFWSTRKGVEKGTIIIKPDVKFTYKDGKLIPPDDPYPATRVIYTGDLLLEEARKLGYPGAYVKEIPLK